MSHTSVLYAYECEGKYVSYSGDSRNEVFISKRRIDTTSNYVIEQTDVSLKSKDLSIDDLIKKAKEAVH